MQLGAVTGESARYGLTFETHVPGASEAARSKAAMAGGNVRAVGFIAKPERATEVAGSVENRIAGLLWQQEGFAGAMVLQSQTESRSLLVLTFWQTEAQAATNCWEEFTAVKEAIAPMIDVCTKVQIFRALSLPLSDATTDREPAELC